MVRSNGLPYTVKGKIKSQQVKKDGKLAIMMDRKLIPVHQLVALAFIGPRPDGMDVCHNNGDGQDNRPGNLRYDTRTSNNRDTVAHGTHWQAQKTHCKWGHEFTPENTYTNVRQANGRSYRKCRSCEQRREQSRLMVRDIPASDINQE